MQKSVAAPPYLLSTKKGNCTEHTRLFNWEYSLLVYHGPFPLLFQETGLERLVLTLFLQPQPVTISNLKHTLVCAHKTCYDMLEAANMHLYVLGIVHCALTRVPHQQFKVSLTAVSSERLV